ncbi:MAG: amidase family protein [Hyphomicrobiaceae bacterium]|nr:amidase family protein [Hyphomicrobiaceae bacterium]
MSDELIRLTARQAVRHLEAGEITPLDLIEAAEKRIAACEPALNALPTLCLDRARDHARRLMRGEGIVARGEPGWLAGLPVAIKDVNDVAGVRTTYGSPIYKDHVPQASHPVVERIERKGGIVIAKSNTPEFAAGGSTFNEVFGRTTNPWNTSLTPGGSTGGGAAALAAGEVWLAHGSDHAGSLRRPASFCSVVGLRPSPGRVTRGTSNNLYAPLSVQGPMARNVGDLALFLDSMAGFCPRDPQTFDAPTKSFLSAVEAPVAPRRIAWTESFGGAFPVEKETRDICKSALRHFVAMGALVEEAHPDPGQIAEAFMVLRSQSYVVDREPMIAAHRALIKPDIIWNTEEGLKATPSRIGWADRERAAFYRRVAAFFETFDVLVLPCASSPAFDVNLRMPSHIDGKPVTNYLGGSLVTAIPTLMGTPALALPCGFDKHGRPVGLQMVGRPRGEAALLAAGGLFEAAMGLAGLVPIDPRPGNVPADG